MQWSRGRSIYLGKIDTERRHDHRIDGLYRSVEVSGAFQFSFQRNLANVLILTTTADMDKSLLNALRKPYCRY